MAVQPIHPRTAPLTGGCGRSFRLRDARRGRARAFTLVETLVSLMVVSFVALASFWLLDTVLRGTQSGDGMRRVNMRLEVLAERIDSRFRAGAKVVYASKDVVILWTGDRRPNQFYDLSELCIIYYDKQKKQLRCFEGRPELTAAEDARMESDNDFLFLIFGIFNNKFFKNTSWADNVTSWGFSFDSSDESDARAVMYSYTVQTPDGPVSTRRTVAMRGT